jgi:hypothetical protein
VDAALYWTIWISLALFAAGEVLKPRAWLVSAFGLVVLIIHVAIAMDVRHGWSHSAAIAATARQTFDVYGLRWGGGYFVNYAFMAAWIAELAVWRMSPDAYLRWSGWPRTVLRAFYLVMIVNAAIVFAAGARRAIGAVIVVTLIAAWSRRSTRADPAPKRHTTRRTG